MSSNRQLAVIMFTDIVGYTALMGRDEQIAFDMLHINREIQRPIIEQFNGRWIKEIGDGIMASFSTVSDAVNAAVKIQESCNSTNKFQLRIGIHLGEVVFESDDVFGDGVNIASRIQCAALPDSIFISEPVYNNIFNKAGFQTKFIKEEKLKNVRKPMRIYQVVPDGIAGRPLPVGTMLKNRTRRLRFIIPIIALLIIGYFLGNKLISHSGAPEISTGDQKKSIAVLPFINISADSSQEYFSDGMTESLITDLAQVPGLLVIARNSVFQYKGKTSDPRQVGSQLKVKYVLQGKVQHVGELLRIHAQLVETENGTEVWAKRFDNRIANIFSVQDSISKYIIGELKIVLEKDAMKTPPTQNLEAYDYYLRGHYLLRKAAASDRDQIDSAIVLFKKAVDLDSRFALAYASLGKAYTTIYFIYNPDPKVEAEAFVNIEKSLSIDPELAYAHSAKGDLSWTLSNGFPHEKAIKEYKRAIALNPNLVEAHEGLGSVYFHIGLFEQSLQELRTALILDPAGKFSRPRIARVHWYQQQFDSALIEFSAIPPSSWLREQAMVLWNLGRREEAFRVLDQCKKITKTSTENYDVAAAYAVLYAGMGNKKEAEENIGFAIEHGEGISHFHHAEHLIASAYALMGNADDAVEWLQKAADHGFPAYPLFLNDPNLKNIKNDPGYRSFMEKLKRKWELYKANL